MDHDWETKQGKATLAYRGQSGGIYTKSSGYNSPNSSQRLKDERSRMFIKAARMEGEPQKTALAVLLRHQSNKESTGPLTLR